MSKIKNVQGCAFFINFLFEVLIAGPSLSNYTSFFMKNPVGYGEI